MHEKVVVKTFLHSTGKYRVNWLRWTRASPRSIWKEGMYEQQPRNWRHTTAVIIWMTNVRTHYCQQQQHVDVSLTLLIQWLIAAAATLGQLTRTRNDIRPLHGRHW